MIYPQKLWVAYMKYFVDKKGRGIPFFRHLWTTPEERKQYDDEYRKKLEKYQPPEFNVKTKKWNMLPCWKQGSILYYAIVITGTCIAILATIGLSLF
jgi:hypothetical protein